MLKLEQAVLVEGKYDAARLTNLVDATILTTDGSRVFRDKELQNMLKRIAAAQGLIILTESDSAPAAQRTSTATGADRAVLPAMTAM